MVVYDFYFQAQTLLKKSAILEKISQGLQRCATYQPCVHTLPVAAVLQDDDCHVTTLHRDRAVTNIRFFIIFYGYSAGTFALSVNILDRLLGKVKVCMRLPLRYVLGEKLSDKWLPFIVCSLRLALSVIIIKLFTHPRRVFFF